MIPDFPHNISIGPILFLNYEESLVLSNLNSNLLRFHCAHPNVHSQELFFGESKSKKSSIQKIAYFCTFIRIHRDKLCLVEKFLVSFTYSTFHLTCLKSLTIYLS